MAELCRRRSVSAPRTALAPSARGLEMLRRVAIVARAGEWVGPGVMYRSASWIR